MHHWFGTGQASRPSFFFSRLSTKGILYVIFNLHAKAQAPQHQRSSRSLYWARTESHSNSFKALSLLTVGKVVCLVLLCLISARRDKVCPQYRARNRGNTNRLQTPQNPYGRAENSCAISVSKIDRAFLLLTESLCTRNPLFCFQVCFFFLHWTNLFPKTPAQSLLARTEEAYTHKAIPLPRPIHFRARQTWPSLPMKPVFWHRFTCSAYCTHIEPTLEIISKGACAHFPPTRAKLRPPYIPHISNSCPSPHFRARQKLTSLLMKPAAQVLLVVRIVCTPSVEEGFIKHY